uniref:Putative secreted peptide n=1 Tax=Anopheles braziliensis TaxID=58242 RepID=A0A2M3ZND4_9DIPT
MAWLLFMLLPPLLGLKCGAFPKPGGPFIRGRLPAKPPPGPPEWALLPISDPLPAALLSILGLRRNSRAIVPKIRESDSL